MKNTHKKHSEEAWENHELGATEKFAREVSTQREKTLDKKLGLQSISIRLQKSLIDELKILARDNGLGYQPYIRQLLTYHVRSEKRKQGKPLQAIGR